MARQRTPDERWAVNQTIEVLEGKDNPTRASFVMQRASLLFRSGFTLLVPTATPGGIERIRASGPYKDSHIGLIKPKGGILHLESSYRKGGGIEIATLVVNGNNTRDPDIKAFVTDQTGANRDDLNIGAALLDALEDLDELRGAPAMRDLGTVALGDGIFLHENLVAAGTAVERS
jgi:hypothetical protein